MARLRITIMQTAEYDTDDFFYGDDTYGEPEVETMIELDVLAASDDPNEVVKGLKDAGYDVLIDVDVVVIHDPEPDGHGLPSDGEQFQRDQESLRGLILPPHDVT